ncbi:MAG: hypothetical protein JWP47_1566 [Polaromonas sp.]|nr:hypothetical protein [Polaromonas sp.]
MLLRLQASLLLAAGWCSIFKDSSRLLHPRLNATRVGRRPIRHLPKHRSMPYPALAESDSHRRYWRKNRIVIGLLLVVWFTVTFGVSYFARALNFSFFGWPFSFWMGAQGALLIYCLIIAFYAWYMNRLDIAFGVEEEAE